MDPNGYLQNQPCHLKGKLIYLVNSLTYLNHFSTQEGVHVQTGGISYLGRF